MARAMKNSGIAWIGSIPSNWKIKPLKYSLQIGSGSTPDSKEPSYWDGEIPWITPADYKTKDVFVSEGHSFITEAGLKSCSTQLIPADSLIFSKRAPIGSVSISANPLTTNQGCLWGIPKQNVDVKYFYYLLSIYNEIFELYGAGTTFKEISANSFGNVKMPVPSFEEQKKIAFFLDTKFSDIISISSDIQKEIETLDAYRNSIISTAVSKGIKKTGLKSSGKEFVNSIPDYWQIKRFKYVAKVCNNLVQPDVYMDYPQVSPENIEKNTGRLLNYQTVEESGIISGNHLFKPGQILYSKIRPELNKVTIATFEGLCSADMYPIETYCNTKFLLYAMISKYFLQQVTLVTKDRVKMPKINQDELGEIFVILPPIEDQVAIVEFLDAKCSEIDSIISSKKQQLEKLTAYKKSLIYEYVTGKKEVK